MDPNATDTQIKWGIDPAHSEIGFKVKHLMITNVKGEFNEFDGSFVTTGDDFLTAEIDLWMNPESIDTGNADRDKHLKSEDFFDVVKYKEITFVGNTIEFVEEGSYNLYGDLRIKGISKRIKLGVEFSGIAKDPWGNQKAGFTLHGKINRKDWGLTWNSTLEAGGVLVGDEILINCEIQMVKQS
jgi:polyisoprenoid-binding protein YceI